MDRIEHWWRLHLALHDTHEALKIPGHAKLLR